MRFIVQWSTESWHEQEVEAKDYDDAVEKWDPDGERTTYQEDLTDKWWSVACVDESCPDDEQRLIDEYIAWADGELSEISVEAMKAGRTHFFGAEDHDS